MRFLKENKIFTTILLFVLFSFDSYSQTVDIYPSQGFGFESFYRGCLGISFLILLTYFLSSNKKAINWKTAVSSSPRTPGVRGAGNLARDQDFLSQP